MNEFQLTTTDAGFKKKIGLKLLFIFYFFKAFALEKP